MRVICARIYRAFFCHFSNSKRSKFDIFFPVKTRKKRPIFASAFWGRAERRQRHRERQRPRESWPLSRASAFFCRLFFFRGVFSYSDSLLLLFSSLTVRETKMRNPSSCRAFLSAFDETIATHPRSIAGATFVLCLACTAVAFLVTGIRVSTEGLCFRSLVVVLFFFRIESSLDIFGTTFSNARDTNTNTLSLSLSLSLKMKTHNATLAKTTTTTQDGTCEERSFRTDLYSLKRSWNPGDVPTARVT
jgi:hypothetical protein